MKKKIHLHICSSDWASASLPWEAGSGPILPENYTNNRYPLVRKPLMELPLGSIKAKGWLQEMLVRQKKRGNRANGQTVSAGDGRT